jgi:hypothetical protein
MILLASPEDIYRKLNDRGRGRSINIRGRVSASRYTDGERGYSVEFLSSVAGKPCAVIYTTTYMGDLALRMHNGRSETIFSALMLPTKEETSNGYDLLVMIKYIDRHYIDMRRALPPELIPGLDNLLEDNQEILNATTS